MKTLYLIRHGQSLANTGAKSMPDTDIPLTSTGIQQAKDLLTAWLTTNQAVPSQIYHSQLLRSWQTAQVFIEHFSLASEQIQALPLLNEFRCLGYDTVANMVGTERAVLAKKYWETAHIDYQDSDDADSFADFLLRVDGFIDSLDADDYLDNSLFFGHGIWIGLLAWRLLGCEVTNNAQMQKFRQFQTALPMHNTVVYQLTINADGIKQLQWFH